MTRGRSFYAIWDEENNIWSMDEGKVQTLVDRLVSTRAKELREGNKDTRVTAKYLRIFSTNKWTEWKKYSSNLPDRYKNLDEKLIFANEKVKKEDFVTKILPYPLIKGDISAYEELISTLYAPEERQKLEWAIGSIIKGDSKKIQKFIVLYGGPGTGKSTVLNIIQMLFPGFYSIFEAKELTSNGDFALESLKQNSLIGIQHDGDLSRIEDNTKLNSIVSHEEMIVNEKFKSKYKIRFNTFLFMGTNKPVRITDTKSGIIRRLIDVVPTGERIKRNRYEELMSKISFELGSIAEHCLSVYEDLGYKYYDSYIPNYMIDATNDFYNFIVDNYELFVDNSEKGLTLKIAWKRYKEYCDDALIQYPLTMRIFKTELKGYFSEYFERLEGSYSVYKGFIEDKFTNSVKGPQNRSESVTEAFPEVDWLEFKEQASIFDDICKDCFAQYPKGDGTPNTSWDKVTTKLFELDTRKLHYVRVPEEHIVIDFDLKDSYGNKSFELNKKAARKWPKTYAEVSKSGAGIHLHYIYAGDVSKLRRLFAPEIEVKVYTGKASLRRMLTLCNNLEVSTLSSGLPIKEDKKMLDEQVIKSEKSLRELIKRNLRKEIHANTKPSMDFIYDILDGAYKSGLCYDVRDMRPAIQAFALNSTNQSDYCLNLISKMKFKSEEPSENKDDAGSYKSAPIVFFDVEINPNVFIICYKKIDDKLITEVHDAMKAENPKCTWEDIAKVVYKRLMAGEGTKVVKMINPSPEEVEALFKYRLVGFNNRDYDNHMIYAAGALGYSVKRLYDLNCRIIKEKDRNAKFGEAYNLSYTDIYDYMSAGNKASLKKWEIKMGVKHQEFPHPWDVPLDESLWEEFADYCCNDVIATEIVWIATQDDFLCREILADWADMTVNDTTNSLTTRIVVGTDPNPQSKFIYTDLSTIFPEYEFNEFGIDKDRYNEGAKIVSGKSIYKGKDPGEGGYAIGYEGVYYYVALLDVASMHPSSIIVLNLFGEEYTMRYEDIKKARLYIKHKDYEKAKSILPPKLHHYLDSTAGAKKLGGALKTPLNSAYGLTAAKFPNKLRDPRNKDNIVAKYGALFMINLEEEVVKRGYKVAHIKTDSIKIANADREIIDFVIEYGRKYGYEFEHEATYEKMALMNDAVYIAKYASSEWCNNKYGYIPEKNESEEGTWTATGAQFQVPYVFKSLFSHEKIVFSDVCETKSVTTAMYLDFNEGLEGEEPHDYRFIGRVGLFVPVKEGLGGGILLREGKNGKFAAVNGTKVKGSKTDVYRFLDASMAKTLGITIDDVDLRYYNDLVDEAVADISKFCDFEEFVSGDSYDLDWIYEPKTEEDSVPFDDFPMNKPE